MAAPPITATQGNHQVKNGYHVKTWGDGSRYGPLERARRAVSSILPKMCH